jgi:internalin A
MNGSNEREILKLLRIIQKIEAESNTEETFLEKANNIFSVQPTVLGVGVNVNEIIKIYLQWRKRQS